MLNFAIAAQQKGYFIAQLTKISTGNLFDPEIPVRAGCPESLTARKNRFPVIIIHPDKNPYDPLSGCIVCVGYRYRIPLISSIDSPNELAITSN